MHLIYTLALRLGLTVLTPYLLLRSRKYWPTVSDRIGRLKLPQLQNSIWLHAVSVGEIKAVERLLERIREEFPQRTIVVSTTTTTGQQLAARMHSVDYTIYFPLDLPAPVRRTLDRVRPDAVIVAETEIWPNFLRECQGRAIPVLMINGRISDTSLRGYRRIRRWLGPILQNYSVLGMQSETDRQRIESLGADPNRVKVFGNLKYDVTPARRPLDSSLAGVLAGWKPLWIAASTMQGEDEMVLDAFIGVRKNRPELKLMIAPRHPDRADAIIHLVRERELKFTKRSAMSNDGDVLVLDTIGELAATFEFASVVFMGGSLVDRGGHNVLEPARYAKPVIFGPHMENFRDIAVRFIEMGAALQIPNAAALGPMVEAVLENPVLADALGRNAFEVVIGNAGATERVVEFIREKLVHGEVPNPVETL